MSINSVIPLHYKEDLNLFFKVKSIVAGIIGVAIIQSIIAFAFLLFKSDWFELGMNLFTGLYSVGCIFILRYFKSLENYLNAVLSGFYLFVFAFVIFNGGLLSDAIFWLAILLTINVLCTKRQHAQFWATIVLIFVAGIAVSTQFGVTFNPPKYDETYRAINLVAFYSALLITAFIFASLRKNNFKIHQKDIGKLRQLHEEKRDMINVITHDLKSPTNRILGLIEVLDRSNLREEQLEIIELIKKTNDSSNGIINSILGPSKCGKKKSEAYELGHLIKDITQSYRINADSKAINLVVNISDNHLLTVDRFQLIRILDNLITNAIKFSQIGGEVKISTYQTDGMVKVLVTDSGPGFSEHDRKFLFDKSVKLSAKPTGNEASHRLGLYIVNKLSLQIGVKVDLIESSAMGSTFELAIPLKELKETKTA
ncbi:sensor histidine kinase [Fulvivirga lutimaris]|uniref:sensor histidine kinase n=1 Tax=Fulvivirga lutimaris TaxID=1819566 RepID=UPI0012BC238A|nr:HAMP domain-containing sensor histidine kinase [Fulvivirga lutimaris]MTI37997.1 hypothetical protein [Fulvivirga lutimaris]